MAKFITVRGNMFDSKAQVLADPVNCVGVMGAGLAKQFKARYPDGNRTPKAPRVPKGQAPPETGDDNRQQRGLFGRNIR